MANTTPHTGFEPASHYGPTVFKTAPSPPGHTAYKGDEDRTHTYGIKTRCAAITLRPYHDSRGTRTPNAVFLQHRYSKPAPYLLGYTATISFTTLAGLEPAHRSPGYSRFSKPLPYLLGLQRHSKPTKWVRQGFGTNPDQRQRKDSNLHRVLPLHSPSKQASYQLEYAATPNPQSGCDKDFVRNPDQYLRQDSNLQSTD